MSEVYASGDRIEARTADGNWTPAVARSNVYRGKDILLVGVEFPPMRGILPWPADAVRHAASDGEATP